MLGWRAVVVVGIKFDEVFGLVQKVVGLVHPVFNPLPWRFVQRVPPELCYKIGDQTTGATMLGGGEGGFSSGQGCGRRYRLVIFPLEPGS